MKFSTSFSPAGAMGVAPTVDKEHEVVDDESRGSSATNKEAATLERAATNDEEVIAEDMQPGIQRIQATLAVWSKTHLTIAYLLMLLISFTLALESTILGSLTPYVTSSFGLHSLTATTGILSSLIGGLSKLPLAKILDIWGRVQGFAIMVGIMTIGTIMMAACNNVQTYAAAQVFFWVGYNGIFYTISIFIADTSHLKNRGLMLAYIASPYIVTTWIGGPAANSVINQIGFRWGFGIFCIVQPIVCIPLWVLFAWNERKARKAGLLRKQDSGRSLAQSIKYYVVEFDLAGMVLLAAGLALFLLSFSLYSYQAKGWKAPLTIAFLVVGFLLIIAFGLYEKFLAPKTFIPWEIIVDRTIIGSFVFSAVLFVEFYIWDSYFFSFLRVVPNQTITQATYIANIYTIGACVVSFIAGLAIRWTGRFKWVAMYFGIPLTILGISLMIVFRQPDVNIGYIVMCQIFIAFGGGACVICEQVAAMAAVSQQHVAVILATLSMFTNIGGSIGQAIAAAMWTGIFPKRLMRYLPAEEQANFTTIYGSLVVQTSYAVGTPTRDAINQAYADAQKYMLIGGTAVLAIAWVACACWRDIKVKDLKQVKGRVV